MTALTNHVISAILQVLAFTLIPFIFYLFRKDKTISFFKYIGLYKPSGKSIVYVLLIVILFLVAGVGLAVIDDGIRAMLLSPNSVTGQLRLMGLSATTILVLLIIALIKTSLAEEILFRGFIARQLIARLGFKTGNVLQATLFGLIHLILFWALTKSSLIPLLFIFVFSTMAGLTIGYIKVKHANGSIVPGWVAHGVGNMLSYYIIAFVI